MFKQCEPLITERCIDGSPHKFIELVTMSGPNVIKFEHVLNLACEKCLKIVEIRI